MAEDYYKLLGVERSASKETLQSAFQKKARKYHPDVNPDPDAQEQFKKMQQAYEVLSNEEKRAMYDQYGDGFEQMGQGGFSGGSPFEYSSGEPIDLSDILGGMFGGGGFGGGSAGNNPFGGSRQRTRGPTPKGSDLQHTATIAFKKAIEGGKIDLQVRRGTGKNDTITMKIPPGVVDGGKLRVKGQGEPSPYGGKSGDIVVTIKIKPHEHFRRSGKNLEVTAPVTITEAILGAKIDVPTPVGTVTLKVPPGSSGGSRLRVKGQGVKPPKGEPGDLFVVLQIVLPAGKTELTDQEQKAIENYAANYTSDVRASLSW